MSRLCKWSCRVNTLWLWWYCFLVIITEGYLMYRAVERCKHYNELPWREEQKPVAELYVYILLIVVSIMCIPFLIITAVFRIGSYANDGTRLGRDDVTWAWLRVDPKNPDAVSDDGHRLLTIWRHMGPLCQICHIVASFTLLLPSIFLESREIEHGFHPPSAVFNTELTQFIGTDDSQSELRIQLNSTIPMTSYDVYTTSSVSPEFINYLFALLIYSLRYPSVFWYTKKSFGMIFSCYLVLTTAHALFTFCSVSVLYKFQVNNSWFTGVSLVLPHGAVLALHIIAGILIFLSSISVFNYGFHHYNEAKRAVVLMRCTPQQQHVYQNRIQQSTSGCQGYVPHTTATIFLVLVVVCRAAIVYDTITVYRKYKGGVDKMMLTSILFDVAYMLTWIILWFSFTLKQSWGFRVLLSSVTSEGELVFVNCASENGVLSCENPCSEHTEHNRSSSFRKSNERKAGHVTFENDAFDGGGATTTENGSLANTAAATPTVQEVIPRRRSGDRRKSPKGAKKNRGNSAELLEGASDADGVDNSAFRNSYGDHATPENTLTRHYRHSIRNKCGQYYRNSKELAAKQLHGENPRKQHQDNPRERPHSKTNGDVPHGGVSIHQNIPYTQSTTSMAKASPLANNNNRISERTSGASGASGKPRTSTESGISSMSGNSEPAPPVIPPKMPLVDGRSVRQPSPSRTSKSRQPSPPENNEHPRKFPVQNVKNNINTKIPPTRKSEDSIPYRKPQNTSRTLNLRDNSDIHRRDSALPSSNESSSNDSSDNVLCSQV